MRWRLRLPTKQIVNGSWKKGVSSHPTIGCFIRLARALFLKNTRLVQPCGLQVHRRASSVSSNLRLIATAKGLSNIGISHAASYDPVVEGPLRPESVSPPHPIAGETYSGLKGPTTTGS